MQFRHGSRRYEIKAYADQGMTWQECFAATRPRVIAQERNWVFKANPEIKGGRRTPKPMSEQLVELKNEIRRVYAVLGKPFDDHEDEIPEAPMPTPEPEEVKPERPTKKTTGKQAEREFFFNEWKRLRKWVSDRSSTTGAAPVDSLDSLRPVIEARRAIDQGIPANALVNMMCLHWSPDTKQAAGIAPVDFDSLSEPIAPGFHHMSGLIVKLLAARIPVALIGPSGTGKTTLLRKCAEHLGMPSGAAPMTAGATPSWLLGRYTLDAENSFKDTKMLRCLTDGGVFVFNELDASDPNMLLVANDVIALEPGEIFDNPVNGEEYVRHGDFLPGATMNTFGLGANAQYTGRERIDLATIDRFRMGRVYLNLDEDLAHSLMFGNHN